MMVPEAAVAEEEVQAEHHWRRGRRKQEEEVEHVARSPLLGPVEIVRNLTAS